MMKRKLLFILMMSIANFAMAQKAALLTDFRFIVNDTQEFPNFFEDDDLTLDIYNIGLELIQNKLGIDKIEPYQAKKIEYHFTPPFRDNLDYVERTDYDYFVAITSSAGVNTSAEGLKTYIIYSKVRIENEQGDTLYLNKNEGIFHLQYEQGLLYNEAVIDKNDFKNLYKNLITNTFLNERVILKENFIKPTLVAYNGFINKAEKTVIIQNDKTFSKQLLIKNEDLLMPFLQTKGFLTTIDGTIRIQDLADILKFRKEFILKDKPQKKRLKIIATYEEATDYESKVRYIKSAKFDIQTRKNHSFLEFYPNEKTSWVYTLEWTISETESYRLIANAYTNYAEIFSDRGLVGIIQLPSSGNKLLEIKGKEFIIYTKSELTEAAKLDLHYLFAFFLMANEFMAEVGKLK
jgi:hypothetical protein